MVLPMNHRFAAARFALRTLGSAFVLAAALAALACNRAPDQGKRVATTSARDMAPQGGAGSMSGQLPEGHPPIGTTGGASPQEALDPETLPLKEKGSGSLAELTRGQAATKNAEAATDFAQAFRLTFTSDNARRDYPRARELYQKALALDPKYAEAYRGLAYAEFNIGFNRDAALTNYMKAIELKPDYGEAHYALAFMYAMDDVSKGEVHFKKAMELGVDDERNLGQRFYPNVKIETH
jgi:tetratricopeptide (TPR) repeat protein